MDEQRLIELESRIDLLQDENILLRRRMRSFSLVAASLVFVVIAGGAYVKTGAQFQGSVEVMDRNNNLRSVIYAENNDNKSGFEIRDPNSNMRFDVHTNANHDPFLQMFDKNLRRRIELGIAPNGDAYLLLLRGDGSPGPRLEAPL